MEIDSLVVAYPSDSDLNEFKVYIHLNEQKNPADRNYFYQTAYLGTKLLLEYHYKVINTSIKNC